MSTAENSKRIARNTIILYFRMIFLMFISLYTSRVILDALGASDYGIYNVVGGFVSLFAIISAALTSASSRFLNFELGKSDVQRQKVVFSTALSIQCALALIVLLVSEGIGVWYINNKMVLPADRLNAANWCFQFSVVVFCMNLVTVPYKASIIAHEKMKAFAYVSIYEGVAKLAISFLVYFDPFDRLVFYALMLLVVQVSVMYAYNLYCRKHFIECQYIKVFDKPLLQKMLSYSVWHLVGNGATVLKDEGVNVVLNLFFGPVVNAARGISIQVSSAVSQFASNFMIAMNPQITQSYAREDLNYMFSLIHKGCRFSFYLLLLLSLPVILNIHFILSLWLVDVPENTELFAQLVMIAAIITSLSSPLITAQNATGNVRNYQLVVGGILLLNLPVSYMLLKFGYGAECAFIVTIVIEVACLFARIFMIPHTIPEFDSFFFIKKVILNCALVSLVAIPIPLICKMLVSESFLTVILNVLLSMIMTLASIYFIGCTNDERQLMLSKYIALKNKFIRK